MRITLAYGKQGLEVELPDRNVKAVLRKPATEPLPDTDRALAEALADPIGSDPLRELARGKRNAVIVVSDATRPVPNATILPPIIDALAEAGIDIGDVTILVATGLHAPLDQEALEELLGAEVARSVRVENHDGRAPDQHTDLGKTEHGTPVHVDSRYVDADLKILTGLIEPHFMAGFSGGPKAILPGIAAAETITSIHSYTMLGDQRCRDGNIDDNPLQRELVSAARMAGADLLCNVTLNEERQVTGVFCGDVIEAHRAGCQSARGQYMAYVDEPVDIAVSSSAGFPLDTTFYQTAKGMCTPLEIVRTGGVIITASGCADGIGSAQYEKLLLESGTFDGLRRRISDTRTCVVDQWNAQMMLRASEKARLLFYSDGIDERKRGSCLVEPVDSVEQAVEIALAEIGPDASIAVIPEGPYVLAAVGRPQ